MRYHSAEAIGKRGGDFAPTLLAMLDGKDRYARYGAVEASDGSARMPHPPCRSCAPPSRIRTLGSNVSPPKPSPASVTRTASATSSRMSLRPTPADPRRMHQRAASRALFSPYPGNSEPRSILSDSLDGVDAQQLHQVMKSFLQNEDSVVRASIIPVLDKLSDRELAPLLPDLVNAIETLAPTNEMWGDDIRQAGLDILSRRHIREGMRLCVSTIEWRWGNEYQKRLEFLKRYGRHAREFCPSCARSARRNYAEGAKNIDKAIAQIEALTEEPKLVSLKDFIANAKKNEPKKEKSNR